MSDDSAFAPIEPKARHPALARWRSQSGVLLVGDTPLTRLADRLGSTPFFAYDRGKITTRVAELRAALPERIRLHYAVKANPMPAVVQHLASLVDGFDVASAGELHIALDSGMPPRSIGFAGPGKTDGELARAVAAGVLVEIESAGELHRLERVSHSSGYRARVAVRVNPDFKLKGSGMHMGGGPSQFGVDAEQMPALLAELGAMDLDFRGFHIFGGSQNLDAAAIVEAERQIAEIAIRLAEQAPAPVRHLNIGGGFGIPYFPKDLSLDLAAVGAGLEETLERLESALPEAEVVVELGRYIVGEAGVYVCRIVDRKVSRSETYLVTDGGLHHHLAATGNFGQGIRRNYPVAVGTRFDAPAAGRASAVGCLCTPIDLLADKAELPDCEPGDLFVIFQSGAYGRTASPMDFLGHPHAREALV